MQQRLYSDNLLQTEHLSVNQQRGARSGPLNTVSDLQRQLRDIQGQLAAAHQPDQQSFSRPQAPLADQRSGFREVTPEQSLIQTRNSALRWY